MSRAGWRMFLWHNELRDYLRRLKFTVLGGLTGKGEDLPQFTMTDETRQSPSIKLGCEVSPACPWRWARHPK